MYHKYDKLFVTRNRISGAVDQNNLEPAPLVSILDELEEWGRYIEAEPELVHTLRAFDDAVQGADGETKKILTRALHRRGPSL